MTKKKEPERQKLKKQERKSRKKRESLIIIALTLCLGLTSLLLAQWRSIRTSFSPLTPVPTPTPTPQLSKEYIYAGGKLIATEESSSGGGTSPLSPPSSLFAIGDSLPAPQVTINWTAPTGGTVNHYVIERTQNISAGYTAINQNVTAISYTDSSVSAGVAYLYRVRAVDSQNNFTNYSNLDLATTITFADDPLVGTAGNPNPATATTIKATHFEQLRSAVNAIRVLANPNATPFQWTAINNTPAPQIGGGIYRSHLIDLRTNLDNALSALGLPGVNYEHPTITSQVSVIHKADIQELRDIVK